MLPMPAQLDAYKSKDPDHPHDYGFFLTQSVTFLYLLLPLAVLLRKRLVLGAGWWRRQHVPWQTFGIMGLMDCLNALTCTIGELRLARRASQDRDSPVSWSSSVLSPDRRRLHCWRHAESARPAYAAVSEP